MAQWSERSPLTNVAGFRLRSRAVCGLSLLLVLLLFRGVFSESSSVSPSTKTDISKFRFDQLRGLARKPATSSLTIVIYLSIYFIYDILYIYTSQMAYLRQNAKTGTLPVALHAAEQSSPLG